MVRKNDIESQKKSSKFPNLQKCLSWSYTVYRDVLESRQVGRTFIILYNTMDFYEWKLNLTRSCK